MADVLPDILRPDLRLVICGSAAGAVSAARGAYYAGPGNKFWRILAETRLTPRQLVPEEFHTLPGFGIGLTDMCKTASGSDSELPRDADDVAGFIARIRRVQPRMVAFNGKRAAAVFYNVSSASLAYGLGASCGDFAPVWILPSTSAAAARAWTSEPWHALARAIAARSGC
jgi:TDG/mug DNA glycosylase family protein